MKRFKTALPHVLLLLVFSVARLHAQGIDGCDSSPENPTLILGFIASAGGIAWVQGRRYLRTRNNSKNK